MVPHRFTGTLAAVLLALVAGCATGPNGKDKKPAAAAGARESVVASFPNVTFSHETAPFGDVVRKVGQEIGGGIVAISGLEERSIPAISVEKAPYGTLVQQLADAVECRAEPLTHAYFICPEQYRPLLDIRLDGRLSDRFTALNASVAFGAKTRLCNVFAVLSESLGATIVADNFIGDATCGELFMDKAPLQAILEAVLMSARIPAHDVAVDCTDEYLFVASLRNTAPKSVLLTDEGGLSAEQKAQLDRVVNVVLPEVGANPVETAFAARAKPLRDVLTPLTRQLNLQISAKRSLADIPINPCVMHQVRVRTVMDLMVRQWPVADFGYEFDGSQILIRPK